MCKDNNIKLYLSNYDDDINDKMEKISNYIQNKQNN